MPHENRDYTGKGQGGSNCTVLLAACYIASGSQTRPLKDPPGSQSCREKVPSLTVDCHNGLDVIMDHQTLLHSD